MYSGSESCMKKIKTFETKRPKNRLALKKASRGFNQLKLKKKYILAITGHYYFDH